MTNLRVPMGWEIPDRLAKEGAEYGGLVWGEEASSKASGLAGHVG